VLYLIDWWGIYAVVRHRHGFSWSRENVKLWLVVLPTVAVVFLVLQLLPWTSGAIIGGCATLALSYYNLRHLNRLLGTSALSLLWRKVRRKTTNEVLPHSE
jgi:hypothetical protein